MKPVARVRAWHVVAGSLGAVVAAVIVVATLGRLAGFSRIGDTLEGAEEQWLAACVGGQLLVFVGYAHAMRLAFAVEGESMLPVGASIRLVLASFAATQMFAFAGAAGLGLVYVALRRAGRDRRSAAVTLIGLNTSVYLVFATLAFAAATWALVAAEAPLSMTLPWIIGVPIVLALARWFTSPPRRDRVAASSAAAARVVAVGIDAAGWARARVAHRDGRRLLSWAAVYWVGDLISLWAALRAFGAEPPLAALAAAYTAGYVAQVLPIPLIATAGVDAATTVLLHVVGVPLDSALLGVVAHRVFAFWLPIVPGSVFAIRMARERTTENAIEDD